MNSFVPLWHEWASRAVLNGPRHTIYTTRRKDDQKLGDGANGMVYEIGSKYSGEWVNGKKEGFGCCVSSKGNKYQGDWKDGVRHGTGTTWKMSKSKLQLSYAGDYKHNKKHGNGTYYLKDGSKYSGEFHNNTMHGFGILHYANGDVFKGEFKNNLKNGTGVLFYTNGNVFDGHWVNGEKNGPGRYYYNTPTNRRTSVDQHVGSSKKKVYVGEWVDGVARCGEFLDATLPDLQLVESEKILENSIESVRNEKSEMPNDDGFNTFTAEELEQLQSAFDHVASTSKAKMQDKMGHEENMVILGEELVLVLNELGIFPLHQDVLELLSELGADEKTIIYYKQIVTLLAALKN